MWTSTLELDPVHVIPTKLLGYFWQGAYFSSIAPLKVRNLPRQPLPASNWVRVRNSLAGICGSDLHLIFVDGDFNIAPAAIPSHGLIYPGHEVVGEVIEVGNDVRHLHVGDRVVLQSGPNCISAGVQQPCRPCASGHYGLCEYGALPGPQTIGGGWSEEMLLHEQQLFRIPAEMADMQAVLLEPTAVAVHAVLRHLPQAKERVLIIGAGTIGLLILQVVQALVPEAEICVMARHSFQIEQAARLGAKIIYQHDTYKEIQQATGARLYKGLGGNKMLLGGYDVIFDTVGDTRTTQDALRWARAGSTVVLVGIHLHRVQIDFSPIWYQEINLIGTTGHGIESWPTGTTGIASTFEIAAELILRKQIYPDKLITHSFPLSGFREALTTAANKSNNRALKVIFDYSKQPPSVVPNVRAAARQRQRAMPPTIDSHPSQSLARDEPELSYGASLPWIEEETPHREPAVVDEMITTDQELSPDVFAFEEMEAESPFTADIYDDDDFGATDRVPVLPHEFENEASDTTIVPFSAQPEEEDQSLAFPIDGHEEDQPFVFLSEEQQEDQSLAIPSDEHQDVQHSAVTSGEHQRTEVSDYATSFVEAEKEHSILQEASLPGSEDLSLTPAPVAEEEGVTWLHSFSLLRSDESPSWLQALSPSHHEEGEKDAPFSTVSNGNEVSSDDQQVTPPTIDSESEDGKTQTVDVSGPKRSRSKRKTSEQRVTRQLKAQAEERESKLSQPSLLENQEQGSTETAQ